MVDIKISGRKVSVTDALRDAVNEKIGNALKVFDIQPMSCDVVLRVDKNRSNPDRRACEVTVFVRDTVVRVVEEDADMYAAIDKAADVYLRARAAQGGAANLPYSISDADLRATALAYDLPLNEDFL